MKKRSFFSLVVLSLFFVILMSSTICLAAEPFKGKTLKFAAVFQENSFYGEHLKWWAAELEKRTQGKVKVQFFWLETLVKAKDMLPGIQTGFTDMGWVIGIYFPSNWPLYVLLDHQNNVLIDHRSSLFASMETAEREPNIKAELEKQKIFVALPYSSGHSIVGTKDSIKSVNDFKGKVIRTAGGVRAQFYTNLGATPVFMTMPDCYEAFDRGTIWGIGDTPASLFISFKLYEIAKSWYLTRHGVPAAAGFFMNLDVFRSFPKDIQDTILKLREEYAERFGKALMDYEEGVYNEVAAKYNVKIVTPLPEDRKALFEAGEKANEGMYKKAEADGYKGARDVVKYYRTALEKYEAKFRK
jgi:TRAP-type transport system periplasmic protein